MKISEISGEESDQLTDVFIYQGGGYDDDKRTIIAKSGTLNRDKEDFRLMKMVLYDGYIYGDDIKGKSNIERRNQPNQTVQFDTLVQFIDISEIIQKAMDEENIQDHYKFLNAKKLKKRIDSLDAENINYYRNIYNNSLVNNVHGAKNFDSIKEVSSSTSFKPIDEIEDDLQVQIVKEALINIDREIQSYSWQAEEMYGRTKFIARQKVHYQRNYRSEERRVGKEEKNQVVAMSYKI